MSNGWADLERVMGGMMARLTAQRVALSRKVGQEMRRLNAERVAANVTPDGMPMEPRKARAGRKGRGNCAPRCVPAACFAGSNWPGNMRTLPHPTAPN
jgi:hypothetical protein